ncbi:MAG: PilN domain-containing protein [Elusimicrobiota bacterium]
MIKINLLPKEFEEKALKKKKIALIIAVAALFVVGVFGVFIMRITELSRLRGNIERADRRLMELRPVVEKVEELESRKEDLLNKIDVIEGLMEVRLITPVFMEDMADIMPTGVWLTALTAGSGEEIIDLDLSVRAADNYAVADFLNALEMSDKFSDLQFTGLSSTSFEDEEVRTFNISCKYHFNGVS